MTELFIGLMSGTSMDGIDAALVDFAANRVQLVATHAHAYSSTLQQQLDQTLGLEDPLDSDLTALDMAVGEAFAAAANELLTHAGIDAAAITAIGSHGQTIRHEPAAPEPYSLQIGAPETIAAQTGIDVVADFRRADIEAGGQGAPLVPAFHQAVFASPHETRVILNIGGIANITLLPAAPSRAVTGFDTGPGNTLMDIWAHRELGFTMDIDGRWAAGGRINEQLLAALLRDPYFATHPPKSTGREYFNLEWLLQHTGTEQLAAQDVQATLCELTARSVAEAMRLYCRDTARLLVCGGGVHNAQLLRRLAANLPAITLESTARHGLDPDWVEAAAFAWLAQQALAGKPGNIPAVTGATHPVQLGRIVRA